VPITNLLTLGETCIVVKEDGVFAVDITASPITVQVLYVGSRTSTNGVGATVWRGGAYIPFNGRLMAVTGDMSSGFVVYESVGIEALREWDWPWGQGRHVACAGTRHHLYSVVTTTSGYRLLKSADPLRKNTDQTPNPEWHGSLATIGDGSQTVSMLAAYDPGGSGSPHLFCTTTSNNVARIQLPRSFNPSADPVYPYDISTTADLYFPWATGNYPVHPKAWVAESATFEQSRPSDYVDLLWDQRDGQGWHPMGRLYDTGTLAYPKGPAESAAGAPAAADQLVELSLAAAAGARRELRDAAHEGRRDERDHLHGDGRGRSVRGRPGRHARPQWHERPRLPDHRGGHWPGHTAVRGPVRPRVRQGVVSGRYRSAAADRS
jgi:hypothetical protein